MIIKVESHIKEEDLLVLANEIISHHFDQVSSGRWRKFEFSANQIIIQEIFIEKNIISIKIKCDISAQKSNDSVSGIGSLLVDASMPIQIDANSIISTEISINTLKWLNGPKLDLGLFEISLKAFTNKLLTIFNQTMELKVSELLSQLLNQGFQNGILELRKTNASMKIQEGLYFSMTPNSIYLYPYHRKGIQILHCQLQGDYLIGEEQQNIPDNWKPLIAFAETSKAKNFQFNLQLSHLLLGKILKQNLIGRSFEIKGKAISVKDVNYSLENGNQILELNIGGDLPAKLHAHFQILFDQNSQQFHLTLQSLDMKPKNWLHRFLVKAFKQRIITEIEEKGRVQVNDILKSKLSNNFNQFLKSKLNDFGILPEGKVSQLIVEDFKIESSCILASLDISLDIKMKINSIDKILKLYQNRMQ